MIKKNAFNIMLFVFIIVLFLIISCTKSRKESLSGILLKEDGDFSTMSVREGMQKAFLAYIADNGVMLRDNGYPIMGRDSLISFLSGRTDTSFTLLWKPVYEKIAASGELGYTYGIYTRTIKSSGAVTRGTYVTIWEKLKGGTWKFVMDTGTEGLPDEAK